MNPKETIKSMLKRGQVMRIREWARETNHPNIDRLIEMAAQELKNERQPKR